MAVLLRDLFDRHIEAVLLEDAGLVCERKRRKAGPSRNTDGDLDVLCDGWRGHQESRGCGEYSITKHDRLSSVGLWIASCSSYCCLNCCINCAGLYFALILLSTALEAGNQFVGLAWIDEAHGGQRPCAAPGVPVDHEAGRANRNVQRRCGLLVSHDRADRMFGLRPGDMVEQPRAGRLDRKIRRGGFGYRIEIDQPVLDCKRHAVGAVAA